MPPSIAGLAELQFQQDVALRRLALFRRSLPDAGFGRTGCLQCLQRVPGAPVGQRLQCIILHNFHGTQPLEQHRVEIRALELAHFGFAQTALVAHQAAQARHHFAGHAFFHLAGIGIAEALLERRQFGAAETLREQAFQGRLHLGCAGR